MARAILHGAGTRIPVEIMNPLEENVILYEHTQLGIITRLPDPSVICSLIKEGSPRQVHEIDSTGLLEELKTLLDKTEVQLDQGQQLQSTQLLGDNKDVFALPDIILSFLPCLSNIQTFQNPINNCILSSPTTISSTLADSKL